MSDWTEVKIKVNTADIELAGSIASMVVPYGIYIEDYSDLEQMSMEIAHIDLMDEKLLQKDRNVAYVHVYISPEENPAEAVAYLTERYSVSGINAEIETEITKNEDWENNWKDYFHTIPVGNKLLIHPVWEQEFDSMGRVVLDIEPGLAFGSGAHETTRLCLAELENHITPDTTVLDIGCGSGILSLAALKLGAKSATAVDIDALAVKTAKENGERSGFVEPEYIVLQGNLADAVEGKFDVIVANIVADAIIKLMKSVKDYLTSNSVFITSGIIDARKEEVIAAAKQNGLCLKAQANEKGWQMLNFSVE